jgi:hypothetical protein
VTPGRRRAVGPLVALLGLTPFLAAGLLWHPAAGGGVKGPGLSGHCLLLDHTGCPCAGCGACRAIYRFVHGDSSFVQYNWFWVVLFLALVGYGSVLSLRGWRDRPLLGPRIRRTVARVGAKPSLAGAAALALVALPWAVAMLNLGSIRAG